MEALPQRDKTIAYIGTYTTTGGKGIAICELDAETGRLNQMGVCEIENPSYIIPSYDGRFAYAVIETGSYLGQNGGGVAAFRVDPDSGALTFINACPTFGKDPCHLCVDRANTRLAVANYSEGTISAYSLAPDGSIVPPAAVTRHEGKGPNKERQEMPHVHFVGYITDEELLYAVDLGIDAVRFYRPETASGRVSLLPDETELLFEPGSGPRHLVFGADDLIYVLTELSSQVSVFRFRRGEKSKPIQTFTLLPDAFKGESIAAAIKLSPDGRFLYASNRGHDSIAVFAVKADGLLEPAGRFAAGGHNPRDITFSPDGRFLFAACQDSDAVTAFAVDRQTGGLTPLGCALTLPKPVCVRFI